MSFSKTARYSNFQDLKTDDWKNLYQDIKAYSNNYLSVLTENKLWPKDYQWPKDSLNTNTRVWEYPYIVDAVFQHCKEGAKILDIGSALTFLPHYLSHKAYKVVATDYDEKMVKWYEAIKTDISKLDENQLDTKIESYDLEDASNLSYKDETFDAVTNVSVLEHLPFNLIIKSAENVSRVLKKGGVFICTLDCYIKGAKSKHHAPLTDEELTRFMEVLLEKFDMVTPYHLNSPDGFITNIKAPDFLIQKNSTLSFTESLKLAAKVVLEKNHIPNNRLEWTAMGFVLRKK